ncbi:hypothetical protein L596_008412 [Steinernema carpocapsae]|uniref:Uncharacterized protein n=1 Tax=Steinernema carpocapsae TaxID=34508 RepID=A0A4U5PCX6_STECR|nr:hypothetical protein L596_008412 [Steinernema carpocapsae]
MLEDHLKPEETREPRRIAASPAFRRFKRRHRLLAASSSSRHTVMFYSFSFREGSIVARANMPNERRKPGKL